MGRSAENTRERLRVKNWIPESGLVCLMYSKKPIIESLGTASYIESPFNME
jgi:hypothetical protein